MSFVEKVKLFNEIGGTTEEFNARKVCLYLGLVLEELEETIGAFQNDRNDSQLTAFRTQVDAMAGYFKKGVYDHLAEGADRVEMVDGGVDGSVVNLGLVIACGADVLGATNEVAESNLSKFVTDEATGKLVPLLDENGKIKKGENFFRPSLPKYLR